MKTNLFIALILIACAFSACKDEKAEEKAQLTEVLKVHDKVMGNSENVVKYKTLLDTVIAQTTDSVKIADAKRVQEPLIAGDDAMDKWMHEFDAENKGKSHDEIMDYLAKQKVILSRIDSQLVAASTNAKTFLSNKK